MSHCVSLRRSLQIGLLLLVVASSGSIAAAGSIYTAGHADIGVAYEDPGSGSFVFYLLNLSPQFVDVYFSGSMGLRILGRTSLEPMQSSSIQFTWNPVYMSPPFSALPKN
jgi:hypothetical protein